MMCIIDPPRHDKPKIESLNMKGYEINYVYHTSCERAEIATIILASYLNEGGYDRCLKGNHFNG